MAVTREPSSIVAMTGWRRLVVKTITIHALVLISTVLSAQQPARQPGDNARLPLGVPGPNPKGKALEQGYVPEGWHAHAGGLLKYSVQIRFGEERRPVEAKCSEH
jgi:hypothetical protein